MASHLANPKVKQLGAVFAATLIVAGCPVAVVWWLRASAIVASAPLAIGLGMAISLAVSYLGRIAWEKTPGSEDVLFSELMIWGYLHRLRSQRRLANVPELLAPIGAAEHAKPRPGAQARNVKLLEQLVSGLETRDPYLHGHSRRVARHSWMIARQMGLPREEVLRIRTAAAIHDVGKINTPKSILHKPDRLTDSEYEIIKRHPGEGADMAEVLEDPQIVAIVRHHHERNDGSGYPSGLVGEAIPLGARIVAVADTFDAITSTRSYRAASAHKKAIDILKAEAGTHLDADVVKAFCAYYAGRGPVALWAFVGGLPEQSLTWLGNGAAGVASAAKVAALAAIVGGTAAAASHLAATTPAPHPATAAPTALALLGPSSSGGGAAGTPRAATHTTRHVRRQASRTPAAGVRAPASASPVLRRSAPKVIRPAVSVVVDGSAAGRTITVSDPAHSSPGEQPASETPTQPTSGTGGKAIGSKPVVKRTPAEIKREEAERRKTEEAEAKQQEAERKQAEEAEAKQKEAELAKAKKEAQELKKHEAELAREEAKLKREEAARLRKEAAERKAEEKAAPKSGSRRSPGATE
jgi:putative nucleotidyltransferase with HDIG domain